MIAVDEACRLIEQLELAPSCERAPLSTAAGRILADAVVAKYWSPAVPVSAMDGYAVRETDLAEAPVRLPVAGQSFAGSAAPPPLSPGHCVRIFTGAPLPPGADRVVVQEVVVREGFEALFRKPACGRRHVRAAGSDFAPGEVLLDAGARLTPGALVAAAGADIGEVTVFARPRVAVLATGDELAEPGQASERAGAAPDSVSLGVAAMTPLWGGRVVARARLGDALKTLREAAAKAVASADVVVVTGGASGGERDYARAMFQPLGLELVFNGVAMKPGKPVWMGRVGRTTIVGLPGNPSAAMITARLFLAPVLARLAGRPASDAWQWRLQRLAGALGESGERECFLKASARPEGVRPLLGQDSSGQKDLAAADLLIRRRPGARALRAGEFVETLAL